MTIIIIVMNFIFHSAEQRELLKSKGFLGGPI